MTEPSVDPPRHQMPAVLIHDLRSPLNLVVGYAEMLIQQAEEGGNHDFVPDLKRILAAGWRMVAFIEDHFQPSPDESGENVRTDETGAEAFADDEPSIGVDDCDSGRYVL